MVHRIPDFDIIDGGFFQLGVDWYNDSDVTRFVDFIENGLLSALSNQKEMRLKFTGIKGRTEYCFFPQNRFRALITESFGYEMLVETPPFADVVVSLVYNPERDSVLLVKRDKNDDLWPGKWYAPSEHIEGRPFWEEGIIQSTCHRGLREETSLEIEINRFLRPSNLFHGKKRFRIWPVVCTAYTDRIKLNHELEKYKWEDVSLGYFALMSPKYIGGIKSISDDGHVFMDLFKEANNPCCPGSSCSYSLRPSPLISQDSKHLIRF